jgi:serine/threonine protein kinase
MSGEPPVNDDGILADMDHVAAGSSIAGYIVLEQIGRGGMAAVFLARDERLGRRVALKVLVPSLARDEEFRSRFMQESRAAAAADDPHIIPIFEAGEASGVLFIAMRYVGGGDMRTIIRRDGPLPAPRATAILSPVASALDAAHALGLVHRDVKPANMLIDVRPGRPDHVYLSDFGLSKDALAGAGLTLTGQFLGTPDYMSPEQIASLAVDGRADQYALACAAFELLSGAPPFRRDHAMATVYAHLSELPPSLSSGRPELLPAADAVLTRALAKNPADRFPSCRDFTESLRDALRLPPYDVEPRSPDTSSPVPTKPIASWSARPTPADHLPTLAPPAGPATRTGRIVRSARADADDQSEVDKQATRPTWRQGRRRRGALAAAVVLIAGGTGIAALLRHAPPPAPLAPVPGFLAGVTAISASTAWAVGSGCEQACIRTAATGRKLILRRNESGWRRARFRTSQHAELNGISAQPGGSVWAAGYSCTSSCRVKRTLILRWNGSNWSEAPSQSPGQNAILYGVSAGQGGEAFAVGSYSASGVSRTLILRWTGTQWSIVASSPLPNTVLHSVSIGPGGTAWAAGVYCTMRCGTQSPVRHTLILHWNRHAWSRKHSPSLGQSSFLYGVSAGPGKSAWAVGSSCASACGTDPAVDRTLILHWDGTQWRKVPSRSPGHSSALYGVSAGPDGSAWAVGTSCTSGCGTASQVHRTLILRLHGSKWSQVASPSPGRNVTLNGVSIAASGAWAAGDICASGCRTKSEIDRTLMLRWDGVAWVRG